MIDSLHIQNYRLFKDLKIDKLGQVNLIAGKNNTGKTALLEALRILASKMELTVINDIINKRNDWFELSNNDYENSKILFYNYKSLFNNHNEIPDNTININEFSLKMQSFDAKFGTHIGYSVNNIQNINYNNYNDSIIPNDQSLYVGLENNKKLDDTLWSLVDAHPEEDDVLLILKIIDSRIMKLSLNNKGEFIVLLGGQIAPFSLKSLGDGINRLLTIALSLVNSKNKILLIDEFEVGLHHSVQEQLWEIIFKYAKEWNIQVFVTTHSRDTVEAFTYIASKEAYKNMGQYMRLQTSRTTGEIETLIYTQESLENSLDLNLETR
jgi:AAA15 family ATPase/GTPase